MPGFDRTFNQVAQDELMTLVKQHRAHISANTISSSMPSFAKMPSFAFAAV